MFVFYQNVKRTVSNIYATISGWHLGRRVLCEEGEGGDGATRREGSRRR